MSQPHLISGSFFDGDRELWSSTVGLEAVQISKEKPLTITGEFSWLSDNQAKDWSVTAWGSAAEVKITHKGALPYNYNFPPLHCVLIEKMLYNCTTTYCT